MIRSVTVFRNYKTVQLIWCNDLKDAGPLHSGDRGARTLHAAAVGFMDCLKGPMGIGSDIELSQRG